MYIRSQAGAIGRAILSTNKYVRGPLCGLRKDRSALREPPFIKGVSF